MNNTDKAREYLIENLLPKFSDSTFQDYVKNELAGDFAYQLAKYLQSQEPLPIGIDAKYVEALRNELTCQRFSIAHLKTELSNAVQSHTAKNDSNQSIDDVRSLVDASGVMLKWCVKNVHQWNFSEYDWLHSATEKVKKSLPEDPKEEIK